MSAVAAMSARHYQIFRWLLASYLVWHLVALFPYAEEVFSSTGVLAGQRFSIFPSIFVLFDGVHSVQVMLLVLTALAMLFGIGKFQRVTALCLWYGLACLFHQNIFVSNPAVSMLGWLLLLLATVKEGVPQAQHRLVAWIVMGLCYTASGIDKITGEAWRSGTSIDLILNNPMAYMTGLRTWLLTISLGAKQVLCWIMILSEAGFILGVFNRWSRAYVWAATLVMHLAVICLLDMWDVSFGVLLVHLFLYEHEWLDPLESRWKYLRGE